MNRPRTINLFVRVIFCLARVRKKTLGTRLRRNSILITQHYPAPGSADWFKIYYRIGEGYKKRETAVIIKASEYSRLSLLSVAVDGCFIHYHCFYNC